MVGPRTLDALGSPLLQVRVLLRQPRRVAASGVLRAVSKTAVSGGSIPPGPAIFSSTSNHCWVA